MKKMLTFAVVCAAVLSLKANIDGYFMLSMFSPGQIPVPMTHIKGGRVSVFYGECQELIGFDIGAVGRVRERMYGVQAGLAHIVGTDMRGLQVGLLDLAESELEGVQIGLWNDIAGKGYGMQLGVYNQGTEFSGLQIGLVNNVDMLSGCQIGLVNIASRHKCPVLPFVNVRW